MTENLTNSSTLYRIAFISAIVSTLGWIAYVVTATGGPDLSTIAEPAARLQAMADNSSNMKIYGWGGVLGAILSLACLFAFAYAMKARGPHIWLALILGLIGATVTGTSYMSTALASAYQLLPEAVAAPEELASIHEIASVTAVNTFQAPWFLSSFLAYSAAMGWLAYEGFRGNIGPKWIHIVGMVGAVAGITWLRYFFEFLTPFLLPGAIINIVAVSVWAIGLSFVLMRDESLHG